MKGRASLRRGLALLLAVLLALSIPFTAAAQPAGENGMTALAADEAVGTLEVVPGEETAAGQPASGEDEGLAGEEDPTGEETLPDGGDGGAGDGPLADDAPAPGAQAAAAQRRDTYFPHSISMAADYPLGTPLTVTATVAVSDWQEGSEPSGPWYFRLQQDANPDNLLGQVEVWLDATSVSFSFEDVVFGEAGLYRLAVSDEADGVYTVGTRLNAYDPGLSALESVRFGGSWVSGTPADIDQETLRVDCELPNDWEDLEHCFVVYSVSAGATLLVGEEETPQDGSFTWNFSGGPVRFRVVSADGSSRSDYTVSVTKTADSSIFLRELSLRYPVYHDGTHDGWVYESAVAEIGEDNVITVRPRHHLTANMSSFEEYQGTYGWEIDVKHNRTWAMFYVNGEYTTFQDDEVRAKMLAGPVELRISNAWDESEYRDYILVVENPMTWYNHAYSGHIRNESRDGEDFEPDEHLGIAPMQWVEPNQEGEAQIHFDLDWDRIAETIPALDLEGWDMDIEVHVEYCDTDDIYHRERASAMVNMNDGYEERGERPESVSVQIRLDDMPPCYAVFLMEITITEGPDIGRHIWLVLGGVTYGDPAYPPYTALPVMENFTLTPEQPLTGDETIRVQFDLLDTDMEEIRVSLVRRLSPSSVSGVMDEIVPLFPMGDRRTGVAEFARGSFVAGDYEIWLRLNPGRWHEGLLDPIPVHHFAVANSSDEARMTAFSVNGVDGVIDDGAGTITLRLLDNVDKTSLVPVFRALPGNTVTVDGAVQSSGESVRDLTAPVRYTVTGTGGAEKDYLVTVDWQAARSEAQVTAFSAAGQAATIDHETRTVTLVLNYDRAVDLAAIRPVFRISDGATCKPDWQDVPEMDFTGAPPTITVTAEDRTTVNVYTLDVSMNDGSEDNRLLWLNGWFPTQGGGEQFSADLDGAGAHFDLPHRVTGLEAVTVTFAVPELAEANLESGGVYDLREPLLLRVTAQNGAASEYLVTAQVNEEQVLLITGSLTVIAGDEDLPLADYRMPLVSREGDEIGELVTDAQGRFEYAVRESEASVYRFVRTNQPPGRLLRDDGSAFHTASMIHLAPGEHYDLVFANLRATGLEMRGRVVNPFGQGVPGASIRYISELARAGSDGYFLLDVDQNWAKYHGTNFTVHADGYHNSSFGVNLSEGAAFESLLRHGYVDVGDILMDPVKIATPLRSYSVRAAQQYIQRGMPVEIAVEYTANIQLQNAVLTVTVPEGIELMGATNPAAAVGGNRLTLTETLPPNESRTLRLYAYARSDYADSSFTVNASLAAGGEDYRLGAATVSLTDLTLEVPEQIRIGSDGHSALFALRGEATADSSYTLNFLIADLTGRQVQTNKALEGLPTTGVGPWYSVTDLYVLNAADNPGVHEVTAQLVAPDGGVVSEVVKYTNIVPDALSLLEVWLYSSQFTASAPEPVTNSSYASACVYVDDDYVGRDPLQITTRWDNADKVVDARYVLSSSPGVYTKAARQAGGSFIGNFEPGSYAGAGDATIHIEFTESDGTQSRFLVARLTLLIDPSGYVYDAVTGERVQGATAVLEIKRGGEWVVWEAEEFGQHNYQTTDEEGCYGWYVLAGEYRVKVFADGYWDYVTDEDARYGIIEIPPPRLDINIGLTPIMTDTAALSHLTLGGAYKTSYTAGDRLVLDGLAVTAHYSDGTAKPVDDYTTTPAAGAALNTLHSRVSVSYSEGGVTRTTSYAITVNSAAGPAPSRPGRSGNGGSSVAAVAASLATASVPSAAMPSAGPVQGGAARALVAQALQAAPGAASVTVTIENADLLTLDVVREMLATAGGTGLRIRADSKLNGGAVDVRVAFPAAGLAGDLNPRASTGSVQAGRVSGLFRRWFANEALMAMSMEERGALGVEAEVAFRLDDTLRGAQTLYLYRYSEQANRYQSLDCHRDDNGYLHFRTTVGGDFVVSDRPLARR